MGNFPIVILNLFQDLCKITGILNQVQNDTIDFKAFRNLRQFIIIQFLNIENWIFD